MRGNGRVFLRDRIFWISYYLRGKEYRESAKTDDPRQAERFLKLRLKQVGADQLGIRTFVTPQTNRLTIHDLVEALRADFQLRGKASGQNLSHLRRVDADFGQVRATELTAEQIDNYVTQRLADGAAKATINRVTQLLGQAYGLAVERWHLNRTPSIRHLSEKGNERKGFFSGQEFLSVLAHLPDDLKDFVHFAYCTGMRSNEIKSLTWENVEGDVIRLSAEDSKTGEARDIPMVGKLAGILERRKTARQVEVNGVGELSRFVFHRGGLPVGEFRKSWKSACKKAGVNRLFHDFRRTAVRDMDRAGVSRRVAMEISGHKTESMYKRYNIVDKDDVRKALERTDQYREAARGNVVSMR
jgi:integrase